MDSLGTLLITNSALRVETERGGAVAADACVALVRRSATRLDQAGIGQGLATLQIRQPLLLRSAC